MHYTFCCSFRENTQSFALKVGQFRGNTFICANRHSKLLVLVDDKVGQCVRDIINEKCVLTQSQINGELNIKSRLPAKRLIHDRTVARNLERMLFGVKLVRPVLADRTDTDDVLQRRQENENWFINHAIMHHYVFIDECGYNIWTARNHGRERQGMRAYRQVCDQRGWDVTVARAVSPVNGLMFHSAYMGGMNAPRILGIPLGEM